MPSVKLLDNGKQIPWSAPKCNKFIFWSNPTERQHVFSLILNKTNLRRWNVNLGGGQNHQLQRFWHHSKWENTEHTYLWYKRWFQQHVPVSDSWRYFCLSPANYQQVYAAHRGISAPDRGTSSCRNWVRDYPAGSNKHWGCEATWQRLNASWSSCRSTGGDSVMRYSTLTCGHAVLLISQSNRYESEVLLRCTVGDLVGFEP